MRKRKRRVIVNAADIENGTVLGQLEGPSGTVGTAENVVPRLQVDETILQSPGVNGGVVEGQPGELRWSKARHMIRIAAKKYSEDTHADY
jgi:hypothetical protein